MWMIVALCMSLIESVRKFLFSTNRLPLAGPFSGSRNVAIKESNGMMAAVGTTESPYREIRARIPILGAVK